MRNFLFFVLLIVGLCSSQVYFMHVERSDGTTVNVKTSEIDKISFYEIGSTITLDYTITVVDANFKPFPAYSVRVGTIGTDQTVFDNTSCFQTYRSLNSNNVSYTNAQGVASLTVQYPTCLQENTESHQIYLDIQYDGKKVTDYSFIGGGRTAVSPRAKTEITIKLHSITLP